MLLTIDSLLRVVPHVFIDTTGYAFSYPLASLLFGAKVVSYTHYPTISTDMLKKVQERRPTYNNDSRIAQSSVASAAKLIYYKVFAALYSVAGRFADVVMVNSTWTRNHINSLWKVWCSTYLCLFSFSFLICIFFFCIMIALLFILPTALSPDPFFPLSNPNLRASNGCLLSSSA